MTTFNEFDVREKLHIISSTIFIESDEFLMNFTNMSTIFYLIDNFQITRKMVAE